MTRESDFNLPLDESFEQQAYRDERADIASDAAVVESGAHVCSSESTPMVMMGPGLGPYAVEQANQQRDRATVAAERIEAAKILDKDAFKLGDLNPLIHPTDLGRQESVDAVRHTILEKIQEYEGLMPKLESTVVVDPEAKEAALRFIARFEIASLSVEQFELLEELVKQTYGPSVRTRTDSNGNKIPTQNYPPTQPGEEMRSKTGGWYMGRAPFPTSSLHQGLFVFKDYGPINDDNFFDDNQTPKKYIVEIRESGQYQTDLVTFVTQVAAILGKGELIDRGQLLYETYYDLIRLGLKKAGEESIHGMEEALDRIRRELILPLANPNISGGIGEDPQSVLLVGVPGTGKTLIVEKLLQEETGVFLLPIDPFELQKELALPKEKQRLMPRIAEVARITGKRVVLHVDDIENMVGENEVTNSTMLNLMAGVQESGFYIIASTNYPEKINPSLIQPQRFSVLIHCGLQDKSARFQILKIHSDLESKKLGKPLFASEEVRDLILNEVSQHTDGFTPRYLANIATIAKSYLLARVAAARGKAVGLAEEDLEGHAFDVDDWDRAFAEVESKYDAQEMKKKDQWMRDFVQKHARQPVGMTANVTEQRRIFTPQAREAINRMVAQVGVAAAKLDQE